MATPKFYCFFGFIFIFLYIKKLLEQYPGNVYCLEDDFDHKPYADVYDYNKSYNYNLQNIENLYK